MSEKGVAANYDHYRNLPVCTSPSRVIYGSISLSLGLRAGRETHRVPELLVRDVLVAQLVRIREIDPLRPFAGSECPVFHRHLEDRKRHRAWHTQMRNRETHTE